MNQKIPSKPFDHYDDVKAFATPTDSTEEVLCLDKRGSKNMKEDVSRPVTRTKMAGGES